ncbi:hypothetical protein G4Z16_00930 [Streptomyces bathyalis]|uniref:Uncharacterized protein n=1 Tax=Streptomyces bathyalis TaxID=2710756 RepID=A0A7T1WQQ9_9ACTN|nr:hypothetical protein [Streptomyces bathyalis]QPP05187.1 hypothetical protein G4Z16_00930 [Streptomyces bathyalis]
MSTGQDPQPEPQFFVQDYITISRDHRTQLVIALGGNDKAAGILQTTGHFLPAPGPLGTYHRQPHTLPVDEQRRGATAAAQHLLLAGFSVHLDPALDVLSTVDSDRAAAHRYLAQLAGRAAAAADDRGVAEVLTELVAPNDGMLPRTLMTLVSAWAPWTRRLEAAGQEPVLPEGLMNAASSISRQAWQIEQIRNKAATRPSTDAAPHRPASAPPQADRNRPQHKR